MRTRSFSNIYRIIMICSIITIICFLLVLLIFLANGFEKGNIIILFLTLSSSILTLSMLAIVRKKK